jgi:hypothetical protein
MALDEWGIYGSDIWKLYNDVCQCNVGLVCAVFRAYQLGQLEGCTQEAIWHAINNHGDGLDLIRIEAAVKEHLPQFNTGARKGKEEK